jgi:hypothetical protein
MQVGAEAVKPYTDGGTVIFKIRRIEKGKRQNEQVSA